MTLGERVKQEREAKGWSQAELARRVSAILRRPVSQVAVHHVESRGAVNPRFVVELAQALDVGLEWLRYGRGQKQVADGEVELPVRTIVGAGDEVMGPADGDEHPFDYEPAPPGLYDGEVTEVRGRSMLPLYRDGDRLFHKVMTDDPTTLIGEVAVVKLKDGRRFVKVLQPGKKRGLFRLESVNPAYEPIEDQPVASAARILWVKKAHK